MENVIISLEDKIKNKTISLRNFIEVLEASNTDNSIKFIMSLCESELINDYLFSFFNNVRYTEEEINKKYGETKGNILIIYGLTKNLIKEEVIDYKDIDTKNLDSLSMFFLDIQDIPILPKETTLKYLKMYQESKALAQKEICDRYRNLIIEGNIRLIIYVARHYVTNLLSLGDLIDEGVIGLSKAIDEYDFSFDCVFSTYATYWIKLHIQRAYYNSGRSVRFSVHFHEKLNKLTKIKNEFMAKNGRDATIQELSALMGLDKAHIKELLESNQSTISLDERINDDSNEEKYNLITDSYSFEDEVVNKLTVNALKECLNARELDIIMKRYYGEYSLATVGRLYNISRERVRQIETKALKKMREYSMRSLSFPAPKEEKIELANPVINKQKIKSFLDNKTLLEALGDEIYHKFVSRIANFEGINNLYVKAYGKNLDQVFDRSNLSVYELEIVENSVKNLTKKPKPKLCSRFENRTLIDILKDCVPDASDEELQAELSILWQKPLQNDNVLNNIVLIKAFGANGDAPCDVSNLSLSEKARLTKKIYYMGKKLRIRKEVRNNNYENMTLDVILGTSYKQMLNIFSKYKIDIDTYQTFIKAFGPDFTKPFDSTDLTINDIITIYNEIDILKKKISPKMEKTLLNKYYKYLILMLPYEYSLILDLYFGMKYDLETIAFWTKSDVSVVNDTIREGLELIENILLSKQEVKLTKKLK